jgi:gluconolactonase
MKRTFNLFTIIISILLVSSGISQITDPDSKWIKVTDGLNFPEGPAFDGKSSICLSNCYGGWITLFSEGVKDTFISNTDDSLLIEKTNGLAFGFDGNLYVCEYGKGKILQISWEGKIEVYSYGYKGEKFNRPNDLTFDNNGNLFFTDPKSYDKNILDGRIFFVDANSQETKLLEDSLAFPNGINISPVDGKLYVCESAKQKIVRYTINKENGLIDKQDFAEIPGGDPDGIEFDVNGNLFVAHFGGKAVYIFSPEGRLLQKIETPGSKPTNLEFGDEDYKTLYLTEVETNALYKIRSKYPGKNILSKK